MLRSVSGEAVAVEPAAAAAATGGVAVADAVWDGDIGPATSAAVPATARTADRTAAATTDPARRPERRGAPSSETGAARPRREWIGRGGRELTARLTGDDRRVVGRFVADGRVVLLRRRARRVRRRSARPPSVSPAAAQRKPKDRSSPAADSRGRPPTATPARDCPHSSASPGSTGGVAEASAGR